MYLKNINLTCGPILREQFKCVIRHNMKLSGKHCCITEPLREEKTYLKMFRELEKSFPGEECFLDGKKSKTSRPPLAGQQNLCFGHRIGPMEKKKV